MPGGNMELTQLETSSAATMPQSNLFGTVAQETASVSQLSQEIEKLQLKGIIYASDANETKVIISQDGSERAYKQGDVIFADISLSELFPDKIIVKRNNQTETMYLKQPRS